MAVLTSKSGIENIIQDVRNLFRLKEANEALKDKIIRDIRTLF